MVNRGEGGDAAAWEVESVAGPRAVSPVSAPPAVRATRRFQAWNALVLSAFGVTGGEGHEEVVAPEFVRCDCAHFFSTSAARGLLPDAWHAVGPRVAPRELMVARAVYGHVRTCDGGRHAACRHGPGESALSLSLPDEAGRSHCGSCARRHP